MCLLYIYEYTYVCVYIYIYSKESVQRPTNACKYNACMSVCMYYSEFERERASRHPQKHANRGVLHTSGRATN